MAKKSKHHHHEHHHEHEHEREHVGDSPRKHAEIIERRWLEVPGPHTNATLARFSNGTRCPARYCGRRRM